MRPEGVSLIESHRVQSQRGMMDITFTIIILMIIINHDNLFN
jgi:hypothetical protein